MANWISLIREELGHATKVTEGIRDMSEFLAWIGAAGVTVAAAAPELAVPMFIAAVAKGATGATKLAEGVLADTEHDPIELPDRLDWA